MSEQTKCINRKAQKKLIRLLMVAVFKWLIWCLVHRPCDYSMTAKELNQVFHKIMAYEGNLYELLIRALEDSRERARESENSTSEAGT